MELTEEQKRDIRQRLNKMASEYDSNKKSVDADVLKLGKKVDGLPQFVEDVDAEFERLTSITSKDMSFWFLLLLFK